MTLNPTLTPTLILIFAHLILILSIPLHSAPIRRPGAPCHGFGPGPRSGTVLPPVSRSTTQGSHFTTCLHLLIMNPPDTHSYPPVTRPKDAQTRHPAAVWVASARRRCAAPSPPGLPLRYEEVSRAGCRGGGGGAHDQDTPPRGGGVSDKNSMVLNSEGADVCRGKTFKIQTSLITGSLIPVTPIFFATEWFFQKPTLPMQIKVKSEETIIQQNSMDLNETENEGCLTLSSVCLEFLLSFFSRLRQASFWSQIEGFNLTPDPSVGVKTGWEIIRRT